MDDLEAIGEIAQVGMQIYAGTKPSAASASTDKANAQQYLQQKNQIFAQLVILTKNIIALQQELQLPPAQQYWGGNINLIPIAWTQLKQKTKATAKGELKELNAAQQTLDEYTNTYNNLESQLNSKGITSSTIAGINQGVIQSVSGVLGNITSGISSALGLTTANTNTAGSTSINSTSTTPTTNSGSMLLILAIGLAIYYGYKKYAK